MLTIQISRFESIRICCMHAYLTVLTASTRVSAQYKLIECDPATEFFLQTSGRSYQTSQRVPNCTLSNMSPYRSAKRHMIPVKSKDLSPLHQCTDELCEPPSLSIAYTCLSLEERERDKRA